jgi:phenylalanyl-tRNA synthetase beta chain
VRSTDLDGEAGQLAISNMKISYRWLKELVDIEATPQELRSKLTMVGVAVESITESGDDYIFEMEITSNRPDCLNHIGVAREVAAIYGVPLRLPEAAAPVIEPPEELNYTVEIADPKRCRRYSALVMDQVQVGPSPDWMQKRLEALGLRPVNNIVDITNYVLMEYGHPLHAFDFAKLDGGKIIVRKARTGETIFTLDGKARDLDASMLVIADASKPVALAGIMGGLESEISELTRTILLESAYFDPASVRRTAKRLALSTDASYRFERGADINATVKAIERTSQLIREIAGGKVCGKLVDVYPKPVKTKAVRLRHKRITQLIGVEMEKSFVESTLARLGFQVEPAGAKAWKVTPPSHRVDIGIEADLIEEVTRHYGYDKIPATLPAGNVIGSFSPAEEKERVAGTTLRGLGYNEAINWIFINPDQAAAFRPSGTVPLVITNPISDVDSALRTSLIPSLLKVVTHNLNFKNKNVKIFELGKAYFSEGEQPGERRMLGLALTGDTTEPYWGAKPEPVNFFHIKGAVEALLGQWRIGNYEIRPAEDLTYFHPYIAGRIYHNGRPIGSLGRLHPSIQEEQKLEQEIFLAEIDMEEILKLETPEPLYERLPRFPAIDRDISFVVDDKVQYEDIRRAILGPYRVVEKPGDSIEPIREVKIFDVYRGEHLPSGKKSLSIRIRLQHPERTLTREEADEFTATIRNLLQTQFNAELR